MTLHISYSHQCAHCSAFYIPFEEAVVCPQCGAHEAEIFATFISEAADSANFNLHSGSYVPGAWFVGSFADHVLYLLFAILEAHRTQEGQTPFDQVARRFVDQMDFGDQDYLREHLYQIALNVKAQLDKDED